MAGYQPQNIVSPLATRSVREPMSRGVYSRVPSGPVPTTPPTGIWVVTLSDTVCWEAGFDRRKYHQEKARRSPISSRFVSDCNLVRQIVAVPPFTESVYV